MASKGQDYLNPLNRMKWQAAIKRRTKATTIGGVRYVLKYGKNGLGEDIVSFKPAKLGPRTPFTPCGTFVLRNVLDETWLSNNE